ncbi:MAG TPA: radical SAM protein [Puia sp.]|nr:radical SAM protein [Puia sp.]
MPKILLFNPRSAHNKYRVPNSILQIAAAIDGKYEWVIVDGNCEVDPYKKIQNWMKTGDIRYLGFTVMPGPQLKQAIPYARRIREEFPGTVMVWGGYFASNQYRVVLESGLVDFVINGPGDHAFPALVDALEKGQPVENIKSLIFRRGDKIVKTPKEELLDQASLPPMPYDKLDRFYPMQRYLGKTYLGTKTLAYHSSMGCPFTCSFCAVVPIFEARWKARTAAQVYADVNYVRNKWDANAIEFHDNNFFVSEKRVAEFARLVMNDKIIWWGEGRIDTIDKYKDETLALMRRSGCKMIFFGAETGNDEILRKMDKGGTQTAAQIREFAARMARFGIIPEYSFVLGMPAETPEKVMENIDKDIAFIKEIKAINPQTEIIIYIYSPVPTEGSELYATIQKAGFRFPEKLEDWIGPQWESFDLRKNPLTPWLTPEMVDKIRNFETVLNGYYPTVSDIRLNAIKRKLIRWVSGLRYRTDIYSYPYEIKFLHKVWKYRQPEIQGF